MFLKDLPLLDDGFKLNVLYYTKNKYYQKYLFFEGKSYLLIDSKDGVDVRDGNRLARIKNCEVKIPLFGELPLGKVAKM